MATPYSELKDTNRDVEQELIAWRRKLSNAKTNLDAAATGLANMASKYSDHKTEVDALPGSDEAELQLQADLSKLVTEFQALKTKAQNAVSDLSTYDFNQE